MIIARLRYHKAVIMKAAMQVFRRPSYMTLAVASGVAVFMLAVLLPNASLIADIFGSPAVSFAAKVKFVGALLGGIGTNFTALSAFSTIAISALFGINSAMMVYRLRRKKTMVKPKEAIAGLGGLAGGALGIGCAACGSLLLNSFLAFWGGAGVLALFPLGGVEFGALGALLLVVSLALVSRDIAAAPTC